MALLLKKRKPMSLRQVSYVAVGWLRDGDKPSGYDEKLLLKLYQAEIDVIVEAVCNQVEDIDLMIAQLVENMNDTMRAAVVKEIQRIVQTIDKERAAALKVILERKREQEEEKRKEFARQGWLSYFMSRDGLKRLRESILAISAQREVENIGMDLARKGIFTSMQLSSLHQLGELSNNVMQTKGQGKDAGRGV